MILLPLELWREGVPQPATLGMVRSAAPAETFLHTDELACAAAFPSERRRSSYTLGRYAAKLALQRWIGDIDPREILVAPGVFGQPLVRCRSREPLPRVSISHSGAWAGALAFDQGHPMGLDLECIDPARTEVILGQATAVERTLLASLPLPLAAAATLLWTAKESLSKTLSTGLMCPLEMYEVDALQSDAGYHVAQFRNFKQYRAVCFGFDDMRCAVTLPRRTEWLTPAGSWHA